jgi:hypothetical protein
VPMWMPPAYSMSRISRLALHLLLVFIGIDATVYLLRLVPTCRPDPA